MAINYVIETISLVEMGQGYEHRLVAAYANPLLASLERDLLELDHDGNPDFEARIILADDKGRAAEDVAIKRLDARLASCEYCVFAKHIPGYAATREEPGEPDMWECSLPVHEEVDDTKYARICPDFQACTATKCDECGKEGAMRVRQALPDDPFLCSDECYHNRLDRTYREEQYEWEDMYQAGMAQYIDNGGLDDDLPF